MSAQGTNTSRRAPFTLVDMHSHWYPDAYVARLRARTSPPQILSGPQGDRLVLDRHDAGRPIGDAYWDISQKIRYMDEARISHSVVSLGNPWLDPFGSSEGLALAAELNGTLGALRDEGRGRLFGMGVLPSGDVPAVVRMVNDIGRHPGLFGVITGTRLVGVTLDDASLDPVWDALQASEKALFVHPHYCIGRDELVGQGYVLPIALGFPFETSVAIARLVLAGVLERFPALRIAVAHGGGTLPFLAGRLDTIWARDPNMRRRLSAPPSVQMKGLFLDGLVYSAAGLRAAAALVGTQRLGFGTDHPFAVDEADAIRRTFEEAFSGADREHVLGTAAVRFFGLT